MDDSVDDAHRGLIAPFSFSDIRGPDGKVIWKSADYDFLSETNCPSTANPKLWKQAQLCGLQGIFKVSEGIYQIRGLDVSNMTLIEGERGVVVIDPLTSVECAKAALQTYREQRGPRAVTGLIYTHPHADHFGGARGVLEDERPEIPILAPAGFMEHAVEENVMAGPAMSRRAVYMYGDGLEAGPRGKLGCGLGIQPVIGTSSLVAPTQYVTATGQKETIDGVVFIFQLTPGTEAPAEMNFYLPASRALCMAENATHTLHNILTLRGAVVRDAQAWSKYIDEAIVLFAQQSDVVFASHHWPTWGQTDIARFLSEQRDLYGYMHDQTIRMMNCGLTGAEIAEQFELPPSLRDAGHAQGFYGSISHNVKAIYQRHMGWYDGNPSHLYEHPPAAAARRYVACMGGIDNVVKQARNLTEAEGDYRFAATLLNHAVFADPDHKEAKECLASVYNHLAYGAENATWRNSFLMAAKELQNPPLPSQFSSHNRLPEALTVDQLLTSLAVQVDGPKAQAEVLTVDLRIEDESQERRLILSNGVLVHRKLPYEGCTRESADGEVTLNKEQLLEFVFRRIPPGLKSDDSAQVMRELGSVLATPTPAFNIVTP
ncbi:uncharacterized protein PV07_09637 [Cladophialophora immunda]|uniref:Metallo-beta-lactamase domain-containing protein n=1 Tax=Cladophialophora immunda TaxID=569365 RepID=A0A0D1ZFH2_9EURO|nr:uncharacterized protein PV07_09637 [Cladophialophora immunda]KIW26551.1 hypothetical protein PV07_09637 [Cladophialophora immunda]OQV02410.1 hypothetical protein CLAIMM_07614 [Cladophialophora immunda]